MDALAAYSAALLRVEMDPEVIAAVACVRDSLAARDAVRAAAFERHGVHAAWAAMSHTKFAFPPPASEPT